jgi:S1-C subfamily serine protease
VDCEGRLVGINSMIVNGMGVAIPALLVQRFVEQALARRAA